MPVSFFSPGFPLEYCDLANCTTQITAITQTQLHNISINSVIRVKFESFHLEIDVDYLDMIDQKSLITYFIFNLTIY